jgi:hypothetical protein
MNEKVAQIDGEITLIESKNVKMEGFSVNKRKNYPYLPVKQAP